MNKIPIEIADKIEKLLALCEKYKVNKLYIFGSVLTGRFDLKSSDIDFIVEIEDISPIERGEILLKLWTELELLFSRKVDLISNMNLKNPYFKKQIEESRLLLYDRAS